MGFNSGLKGLHKSPILLYVVQQLHFLWALRPNAGHSLLILEVSTSHTTTHHSR
jgi:hypothetical protein